MTTLLARLEGETAELGKIPASDVARLIVAVERAVAQAASVVLGDPKLTVGRRKAAVEQSVRFLLKGVEPGSVKAVLEVPDPAAEAPDQLPIEGPSLGETAILTLLDAAKGEPKEPVVGAALLEMADALRIGDGMT